MADKNLEDKKENVIKMDVKLYDEANKALAISLANIKPLILDINSIIPKETFNQFEKIARMNDLIAKQISLPDSFFSQLKQIEILNQQIANQFKIPSAIIQKMESIAQMNQRLTESFQIPSSALSAIESLQKINFDHIEKATSALSIIKNIDTSFLSSINPIFNIGFNWDGILDTISKSFSFTTEEEFKKFEYNWAGFLTIPELRKLYDLWKKGEKAKVKDFFYQWFSNEQKVDNLIEDFNKNDAFKPRMRILKKALKAHINSDYELSIPIILSQIDGIFIDKHKNLDRHILILLIENKFAYIICIQISFTFSSTLLASIHYLPI